MTDPVNLNDIKRMLEIALTLLERYQQEHAVRTDDEGEMRDYGWPDDGLLHGLDAKAYLGAEAVIGTYDESALLPATPFRDGDVEFIADQQLNPTETKTFLACRRVGENRQVSLDAAILGRDNVEMPQEFIRPKADNLTHEQKQMQGGGEQGASNGSAYWQAKTKHKRRDPDPE